MNFIKKLEKNPCVRKKRVASNGKKCTLIDQIIFYVPNHYLSIENNISKPIVIRYRLKNVSVKIN